MSKILLLHGWNWKNYPKHNQGNPWSNRSVFIDSIKAFNQINTPAMPGFCDSSIPERPWGLDDYANWLYHLIKENKYDVIIGYSFGGAVITRFLKKYYLELKDIPRIILISPAIVRKYRHENYFLSKISKVFNKFFPDFIKFLRHIYLKYIIKNKFYTEGDTFQRETYRNIVGIDLSEELSLLIENNIRIHLIFGSDDTATPPEELFSKVQDARGVSSIILHGDHDIANSHTEELLSLIQL